MRSEPTPTNGSWTATLRSVVRTAIVTLILTCLGPFLFGLPSALSGPASLVAGVGCITRIPEAIETIREEKRRTDAEKSAFERFGTAVRNLHPTDTRGPDAGVTGGRLLQNDTGTGDGMEAVRALYRETVMSLDHYEEEYAETLRANVAAELGPDCATAVMSTETLDPSLQRVLARTSHEVARERAEFTAHAESELGSLTTAERRLQTAAAAVEEVRDRDLSTQRLDRLGTAEEHLRAAESECASIIEDRRTEYADAPESDGLNLREYFYRQHDWTHPVIGDALDVIRTVRAAERHLTTAVFDRL